MSEEHATFGLRKNINQAAAIRSMCQTEGFKILKTAFEEKIQKATKKILDPDLPDNEAMELRRKVQVWVEIEKMLKQIMLTGELSSRALNQLEGDLIDASPEVNG